MPFQAIADDSGSKGNGPLLIMAGLIGAAEWWSDFRDHWDACLHEKPTIPYFKFYDAAHRTGSFAGLSERARDSKLVDLAHVIDRHPFAALHMTMDLAEHARALEISHPEERSKKGKKRFKSQGTERSPYFYVYSGFVRGACVHLWRHGEREKFDFIVDEHPSQGWKAAEWFQVIRASMPEPFRSIIPVQPIPKDDLVFLPLQAADFVAGIQRSANTGMAFHWLNGHFTQVRVSPQSRYMGREYFDGIIAKNAAMKASGPPPSDVLTELSKLEGEAATSERRQSPTAEPG